MRYVIDVTGICIDDWENTTLHAQCNGEMWEIPFDKSDVVKEIEDEDEVSEKESAIIIKWYKGSQVGEFVINASSKQLLFEHFYEEYWNPNYGVPNSTMYRFKSKSLDQEYDEWRKSDEV
jgi:hypothetical protein